MIRAANVGNQPLDEVVIHFSSVDKKGQNATSQTQAYGNLSPEETSEYHLVNGSFRYVPVETLIDGERTRMAVTDFVGEYTIPKGNYTYQLAYGPRSMDGDREGLEGQFVYDQTPLDRAIDSAIEEEIALALLEEYYRESPSTLGMNRDDLYSSLRTACVHQQTHKGTRPMKTSSIVIYAKVVCKATSHRSSLNRKLKNFNSAFPLPIRIELQKQNETFSVVDYQFPRKNADYEKDMMKIFSSTAIDEIAEVEIKETTYNHLALKLM